MHDASPLPDPLKSESRIGRIMTVCFHGRFVCFAAAIIMALAGLFAWETITVTAYPDLSPVTVQVITQVPGLAAEEIEQQVTRPLERALSAVPRRAAMRSSSTFGLSIITLIFEENTDIYLARQLVSQDFAEVALPGGAAPQLGPITGPAGEIYRYTLESTQKNLMQLTDLQTWVVTPKLRSVKGVVDVDNFGGITKEYQLVLNPDALYRYNLGVDDVVAAIQRNTGNAAGGRVTRGEQSYVIRGVGIIHSLDDIRLIGIKQQGGTAIRVKDLGQVQFGHRIREGILGKDGNPDAIGGIVTMLTGTNPSEVLKGVHHCVAELQKQLVPMGVRLVPYIDRKDLVDATTHKVGETMTAGILLVILILSLFLGSPRSALVSAVTIPLALATVFVLMKIVGLTANLFSLGAVDFGVVVDGAIVVTEAVLRLREHHPDRQLTADEVIQVARQSGPSIFASTLIIIAAYSPLFAFQGAEGKLFRPMAFTVGFALLGALICALCLVPALAYYALRQPRRIISVRPVIWLTSAYRHLLERALDKFNMIFIGAVCALVAVLLLGANIGRAFLPQLDEGTLWIQVQLPSGISLEKSSEIATQLRRAVRTLPETTYAITQLGRNDSGTDPWTFSHIEMPVGLKPYASWPAGDTKADFLNRLRQKLSAIPGIGFGISQPIQDGLDDVAGGAHSPLVLRVYGHDFSKLRALTGRIVAALKTVPGTRDASVFQGPKIPQIVIHADRRKMARYGIDMSGFIALVGNAMGRGVVTQVYVEDRVHDVTLKLPDTATATMETLKSLPVRATGGALIPLSLIADISLDMGEDNITHEFGERQLTIRVDNGDRALSKYLADAQEAIARDVSFNADQFHLEWAGNFEQAARAQARLSVALIAMLGLMLLLLFLEFRAFRFAALVLGIVPLATLGGLIAVFMRGETLNIATAVGFIALFGVAVQNGIIMVAAIRRRLAEGEAIRDAVLDGAVERFRPIIMTATVATAGMLPAACATGVGTDVQRGLATVIVGGLGIATLLTLFVLPVFLCRMEAAWSRRIARREVRGT
ncbi:Cobalt-zinc-cadmium resistance protein CzcA [Acetobacteraceae bacterium EV16G]|uniref:Cobalt-zinc-cadmium resistance protein CzcA n=1 Tax=Sorlinia euscelidii TaxID=3081148 RepID=A0ABU7U246_9PROT